MGSNTRVSGYLRIGGALIAGTLLVLGALLVAPDPTAPQVANAIVSVAPERMYIEPSDTDGDGVEDWRADFPEADNRIELPEQKAEEADDLSDYEEPATFTGKFAKAFFTDFIGAKSLTGTIANRDGFVEAALDSIQGSTRSRIYNRLNVTTIPDSPEAFHRYGNEMATMFAKDTGTDENELYILERAVKSQNPSELEKLDPLEEAYAAIVAESLALPVPESLADDHAALVTTLEAIRYDIDAMGRVFEDPLFALARVKQHQDNILGFVGMVKRITTMLLSEGVSYEKDEPGAVIYTINI
jgi:hypothetical protein